MRLVEENRSETKGSKRKTVSFKPRASGSFTPQKSSKFQVLKGSPKILGVSRLATVRKEAELKVKKFFTTNVQPELEDRLKSMRQEIFSTVRKEAQEISKNSYSSMLKTQREYHMKTQKLIAD